MREALWWGVLGAGPCSSSCWASVSPRPVLAQRVRWASLSTPLAVVTGFAAPAWRTSRLTGGQPGCGDQAVRVSFPGDLDCFCVAILREWDMWPPQESLVSPRAMLRFWQLLCSGSNPAFGIELQSQLREEVVFILLQTAGIPGTLTDRRKVSPSTLSPGLPLPPARVPSHQPVCQGVAPPAPAPV